MLNHSFSSADLMASSARMFNNGALIPIEIATPQSLVDVLVKTSKPVPQSKTGMALIDTGAMLTSIHEDFIKDLGVQVVGARTMTTPSGGKNDVNTYPIRLIISAHNIDSELPEITTANLEGFKTTEGTQIIALIGRDFLSNCVLIFNGPLGMYTLAS